MSGDRGGVAWLAKADSDLLAIRKLTIGEPVPWDVVCFLAQQTAEKTFKAALVSRGINPPRTHDLVQLATLCADAGLHVAALEADCRMLLRYAAASRATTSASRGSRAGCDMPARWRRDRVSRAP